MNAKLDLEEFAAQLRGERRERSTIRCYHGDLRLFCEYAADPRCEWTAVCELLFGTHPAQICGRGKLRIARSHQRGHCQLDNGAVGQPACWQLGQRAFLGRCIGD